MLKFINGLFIIAAFGLIMVLVYLGGEGMAHHEQFTDVITERWYLLAGVVVALVAAIVTRGKARPAYED